MIQAMFKTQGMTLVIHFSTFSNFVSFPSTPQSRLYISVVICTFFEWVEMQASLTPRHRHRLVLDSVKTQDHFKVVGGQF